jgi:uncharacterized membrane protein YesL
MTMTTHAPPREVRLRPGMIATLTRLGDTLLLGACVAVTSVGVVTAGPALAAAATVVRGWQSGDERPLLRTFAAAVRTQTRPLLLPQAALAAVLALVWIDIVATGHGLPGAPVIRVAAGAIGAFAAATYLAMFPVHAAHGGTWWSAARHSIRLCAGRPWLPVALVAVLVIAGLIVAASPPMVVVMAGPLTLATGVLVDRADRVPVERA